MGRLRLTPTQRKSPKVEQGYALTEVLIAAAILAGVIAVTATGLSASLRGARMAEERSRVLNDASNIAARLEAGIPIPEIDSELSDWTLTWQIAEETQLRNTQTIVPIRVTVRYIKDTRARFSTILLRTDSELKAGI